jgi:glycosyltransferase involved in cell wall biosynthesis
VGRFTDPRKNVRLLLEAYARFRALEPEAPRLVLAGLTGLTEEDLRFSEELGLTDHVEIRQGLSQKELAEIYRGASLFLLSSDEEGLGLVLLEAMASGVPVIATRCGGAEVSVADGENGLLTPVGDPEAFCERMRELWRDPDRRRMMGESGRRTVEARFSFPVAGKRFLEAYDQIIERPKPGIQRQPTRSLSSA